MSIDGQLDLYTDVDVDIDLEVPCAVPDCENVADKLAIITHQVGGVCVRHPVCRPCRVIDVRNIREIERRGSVVVCIMHRWVAGVVWAPL